MPGIHRICHVCRVVVVSEPYGVCSDCEIDVLNRELDLMVQDRARPQDRSTQGSPSSRALSSSYDGADERDVEDIGLADDNAGSSPDGNRYTNVSGSRLNGTNGNRNGELVSSRSSRRESLDEQVGHTLSRYGARNGSQLREEQGEQDVLDSDSERMIRDFQAGRRRNYREAVAERTGEGYDREWAVNRAREDVGVASGDSVVVSEEEEYQRNRRRRNGH